MMNPLSKLCCLPLLVLMPLGRAPEPPGAQEPQEPQPDGQLQKVAPLGARPPASEAEGEAPTLDEAGWVARLRDVDLVRREEAFAALVQHARSDGGVHRWLSALSADVERPQLAWTARLALRELGRMQALTQSGWEWDLRALLGREFESVRIEQDAQGCRLELSWIEAGQPLTRSFRGADLEAILRGQPGADAPPAAPPGQGSGPPGGSVRTGQLPFDPAVFGVYITPIDAATRDRLGLTAGEGGLLVLGSVPGTYAHALGVTLGDVLLELNGNILRGLEDIGLYMHQRDAQDPLSIVFIDNWGRRCERSWIAAVAPADPTPGSARGSGEPERP